MATPGRRFERLQSETAADRIANQLMTAIALGEFGEGDRLPTERELAVQFEVARETVRSALRVLRDASITEVRLGRHGGTIVRAVNAPEIIAAANQTLIVDWGRTEQLLHARGIVEELIARAASERGDAAACDAITAAAEAHATAKTPRDLRVTDRDFHDTIAQATNDTNLISLRTMLARATGVTFGIEPFRGLLDLQERARREHYLLAHAISRADAAEAAAIARRHFGMNVSAFEALRDSVTVQSQLPSSAGRP